MHFIDEVFREIKIVGYLEDLKKSPKELRWQKLFEIVSKLNILKEEFTELTSDEQLYLVFKIHEKKIDMGLCPHFYIFFSRKNDKFHHCCKALNKKRTYCKGGLEKKRCLLKPLKF